MQCAGPKLTRVEVISQAKQIEAREQALDLSEHNVSRVDLSGLSLRNVVFGRHERHAPSLRPRTSEETNFRGASLEGCRSRLHPRALNPAVRQSNIDSTIRGSGSPIAFVPGPAARSRSSPG